MMIDQQYTADREKLQKIRLLMVSQVELMVLLRKLHEILPTQCFSLLSPAGKEESRDRHSAAKD